MGAFHYCKSLETIHFPDAVETTIEPEDIPLDIYYEDNVYQIQSDPRFNGLKYLNFYHRYKNLKTGEQHGQFLGL